MGINKVVYGNTTVIDLSATTLSSTDQLAQGVTAYDRSGTVITGTASGGGGSAVTVTEETLPGGGVAKHITAVDISNDTVDAAHLATGYTAHNSSGTAIVGTMSGGSSVTVEPLSVTQNGTYTAPSGTAYSPVTVNVPSEGGGGSSASPGDVTFYDYDGTVVASYSATDFAALTAMPDNPSHSGLTAQGWNWSLSDAKAYVADYGRLNIGQMYITDDGKTRLYITIDDISRPLTTVMFACSVVGGVTIDWGDGSATETSTATARTAYTHNYAAVGDYVITLEVTSGTMTWTGTSGTSGYGMMGKHGTTNLYNCTRLRKVEIGSGVSTIGTYWFQYCYSLTSITIPATVSSFGTGAFSYCYQLGAVVYSSAMTSTGNSPFQCCYCLKYAILSSLVSSIAASPYYECYSLANFNVSSNFSSLPSSMFYHCYSLTSITIPNGVTNIGAQAFYQCYGMKEYHLLPTTPPTLSNTNAFTGIPSDCIIYVPQGCLEAYQTATNWSTYASYMQEEPS